MGLFDQLVGEVVNDVENRAGNRGAVSTALMSLFSGAPGGQNTTGTAGLQGLLGRFEEAGLGHIVQSWVQQGTPNKPVSPDQLRQVIGDQQVQNLAEQNNMTAEQVLQYLAQVLPGLVDRLTPHGRVPAPHEDPTLQQGASGAAPTDDQQS